MKTIKMFNANDGMKEVEYVPADVAQELYEALASIENDDGSIPKAIWDMRNAALAKARDES